MITIIIEIFNLMEGNFEALNQFLGLLIDQDDLHIYEKLNEGVFYEVHKAETLGDQTCCVRFRKPDSMISANDQKRFFHEILYQHSLKHEAILPLIGYVIPKTGIDKYAIITDYMPHASLNELINLVNIGSPPENWETIKAINIFGIAAGMAYIHQHNLIHCDLKPEHILLDENYYPKLEDLIAPYAQNQLHKTISQKKSALYFTRHPRLWKNLITPVKLMYIHMQYYYTNC